MFCLQFFDNSLSSRLSHIWSWSLTYSVNFSPPLMRLDNSFSCSYFHGQTSWSGCSMLCALCKNITPFFHSPRFFSCPTASKISPTSGIPPLSLLSLWLSIRPYMHFLVQHFYAWSSASSSCLVILVSLSAP